MKNFACRYWSSDWNARNVAIVELPILNASASDHVLHWYSAGLQFSCTQCGNCCTGGPGYVWISRQEIVKLAEHLKISPEETIERYCRKIDGRFSLRETRGIGGLWDCIFLRDADPQAGPDNALHKRRVCGIYPARPQQCRTWPFWNSNLQSRQTWDEAGRRCHGINRGQTHSLRTIEAQRQMDCPSE